MRRIALLLSVLSAVCILPAISQQGPEGRKYVTVPIVSSGHPVIVAADEVERRRYASEVRMAGNVEIKTPVCLATGRNGKQVCDGAMIVHADDAILHEDTGSIEAHGTVTVTPLYHEK